jgi:glycogen debranching enzyme
VISQGLARSEYTRLENAFDREWLVTNGLGGFACGTVSLANTRRYHGLLVASLRPPVERVLMLGKLEVTARYRGQVFELASNEFADKTIFAVSLATSLLPARRARAVVDTCARELLTPVGLRSLSPGDPRYCGTYSGGPRERDSIYHQGVVWSWLLGPFALAHYRAYGDANHAKALLEGIASHLDEACLGTISEILEGSPPHRPRGCMAQAWSVGETYRAWHYLERFHNGAQAPRARADGEYPRWQK